jgi:predicted CXXCH cytochrome family protein
VRLAQAFLLTVVAIAILGGAGLVLAEKRKDVSGTKHDIATPGNEACVSCHIPRETDGELLWASEPYVKEEFSGLKPLCYSCHDGTVATIGRYAFTQGYPEHDSVPGLKGQDCDRCHDPHEEGYGKFVKYSGGAGFCENCHEEAGPDDHPTDVDIHVLGQEPLDTVWDPDAGDDHGTRLFNADGTGPGDYVKCLSCHAPHGGLPETKMNTLGSSTSHDNFLPLCANCHYREPR